MRNRLVVDVERERHAAELRELRAGRYIVEAVDDEVPTGTAEESCKMEPGRHDRLPSELVRRYSDDAHILFSAA